MLRFAGVLLGVAAMALGELVTAGLKAHKVFRWWRRNEIGKRILGTRRQTEKTSEELEYEVTEERPMAGEIILMLIRHGLTFGGGAGLLTENEVVQLAAAVSTIGGLAWSAYRKWQRTKDAK